LGFRIAGDDTTFAFLDRYNFRCFWHAHSMADARRALPVAPFLTRRVSA
jgi:hypothetical protein